MKLGKILMSVVLAFGLVCSATVTSFAATAADGTASHPWLDLPHTESNGVEKSNGNLSVTIKCKEISNDRDEPSNTLKVPTKNTIATLVSMTSTEASPTYDMRIGNQQVATDDSEFTYTFKSGEVYTLTATDGTNELNWQLSIPTMETRGPSMSVSGPSTHEQNGTITSDGSNFTKKQLIYTLSDDTGIASIHLINYTDDSFRTPNSSALGGVWADRNFTDDLAGTFKKDIAYDGQVILPAGSRADDLTSWGCTMSYTSGDSHKNNDNGFYDRLIQTSEYSQNMYQRLIVTDVFGNKSEFRIIVSGINSINDTDPPTAKFIDAKTVTSNGKVTELQGKLQVLDQPGGLDRVEAYLDGKEQLAVDLNGVTSFEQEIKIPASSASKRLQVYARDTGGLELGQSNNKYYIDLSEYFKDGSGGTDEPGGDDPGGNDNPGGDNTKKTPPSVSLKSVVQTPSTGVTESVKATFEVTDSDNGLQSVKITANGTTLYDNSAMGGQKSLTYDVTVNKVVASKVVSLTATDTNGAVYSNNYDLTSYFNTSSGGTSSGDNSGTLESNSDLKRALSDPEFEYDDDLTTVRFELDKDVVGNKDSIQWVLDYLDDDDEIDSTKGIGKYVYEYEFDEDNDDIGEYKVTVKIGSFKTTKTFTLDYRDDSDIANALKVGYDYDDDQCEIVLELDKDKIDGTSKAKWTLPNDETETGRKISYTVKKNGTYTFKIKCDGDTMTYKAKVSDIDKESNNSSSSSGVSGDVNNNPSEDKTNTSKPTDSSGSNGNTDAVPKAIGTPSVFNITTATQTIRISFDNWDKSIWKVAANSFPSGVSYTESGSNSIELVVPNKTDTITFYMENVMLDQKLKINVNVTEKNVDGTDKHSNMATGGAASASTAAAGSLAYDFKPLDLTFRKRRKGEQLGDE